MIKPISKEMKEALINMQDETTHAGYIAYVIYAIGTWLSEWADFDSDEIDREYYERVMPLAIEFLDGYDDEDRSMIDCLNEFMREKVGMKDTTTGNKNNRQYLMIYKDEFPIQTWEQYCDITGNSHSTTALKIYYTDTVAYE